VEYHTYFQLPVTDRQIRLINMCYSYVEWTMTEIESKNLTIASQLLCKLS